MAIALRAPEQRVLLDNITWDLYERLLAAHRDRSVPRFIYDRGQLEIMSPSAEHEQLKEAVTLLVNVVADQRRGRGKVHQCERFWLHDISSRGYRAWIRARCLLLYCEPDARQRQNRT